MDKLTIHRKIIKANQQGVDLHLTANEVSLLAQDSAIAINVKQEEPYTECYVSKEGPIPPHAVKGDCEGNGWYQCKYCWCLETVESHG